MALVPGRRVPRRRRAAMSDPLCIEELREAGTTLGTAAVITSGVLGALFVAHAFGTIDQSEVVAGAPRRRQGSWQPCRWTALAWANVELRMPDGSVLGQSTDARGRAYFAVEQAGLRVGGPSQRVPPSAELHIAGLSYGPVLIAGLGCSIHLAQHSSGPPGQWARVESAGSVAHYAEDQALACPTCASRSVWPRSPDRPSGGLQQQCGACSCGLSAEIATISAESWPLRSRLAGVVFPQ